LKNGRYSASANGDLAYAGDKTATSRS